MKNITYIMRIHIFELIISQGKTPPEEIEKSIIIIIVVQQ